MGSAQGKLSLNASKFFSALRSAISELHNFDSAVNETKSSVDGLESSLSSGGLSSALESFGKKAVSVGKDLTKYVTTPLAGIGAYSLKTSMSFEKAMSQVQATMGATKEDMVDLEAAAKEMGETTQFTNIEAAQALNYLALAGYNTEQMIAALPSVLNLAAAGDMELATASDMLTDGLSALGLASSDSEELMKNMNIMVDQMAKTASKSNTSVSQLGDAILRVGGTATYLHGGLTEVNQVVGLLADRGIKASEAGTHLRNIILAMRPATKEASAAFQKVGLAVVDADGKFTNLAYNADGTMKPLSEIFEMLRAGMADMTELEQQNVLAGIFHRTDLAAATALLNTSADRWGELEEEINGAWLTMDSFKSSLASSGVDFETLQKNVEKMGVSSEDFEAALKYSQGSAEDFAFFINEWAGSGAKTFEEALSDMGLSLEDLQKVMDNTTGAGAQMAATQLDNTSGKLTLLKSQIDALATDIGDILAPRFIELINKVSELVTKFSELDESTQTTIINLGLFAAAVGPVLMVLGKLATGLSAIIKIGSTVGGIIARLAPSIVSGIAKLGSAVSSGVGALLAPATLGLSTVLIGLVAFIAGYGLGTLIYNAIGPQIDEVLHPIFDKIVAAWEAIVSFFTESIPAAFNTFVEYFSSGIDQITGFFGGIITSIQEFFIGVWDTISSTFSSIASWVDENIIQPVLSVIVPIVEKIGEIIAKIWEIIVTLFSVAATWVDTNVIQPIIEGVSSFVTTIITFFQNLWNGIVGIFKSIGSWWYNNVISPIYDAVSGLVESIAQFFSDAWDSIVAVFSGIGEWFGERWDDVCEVFGKVADFFKGVFQDAVDGIEEVFGALVDWFSDLWDDITELFDTAATTISTAFEDAFKAAFNGVMTLVEGAINFFVDGINAVVDTINEIPGVDIGKLDRLELPRLAVGLDYVPYDDYQALLHKGERVLTKEENEAYTSGQVQGGNTFNFYSPEPIDEVTAAEEFKRVQQELAEGIG